MSVHDEWRAYDRRREVEMLDAETELRARVRERHQYAECDWCDRKRPAGAPVAVTRQGEVYAVCDEACESAAIDAVDGVETRRAS